MVEKAPFWRSLFNLAGIGGALVACLMVLQGWLAKRYPEAAALPYLEVVLLIVAVCTVGMVVLGAIWAALARAPGAVFFVVLVCAVIGLGAAAWQFDMVSRAIAMAAVVYVGGLLAYRYRARLLGPFTKRAGSDEPPDEDADDYEFEPQFLSNAMLDGEWDRVRRGTVEMLQADGYLRVHWHSGDLYRNSGYVEKVLPEGDVLVQGQLQPRLYGMGWDPGFHFYPKDEEGYCLSVGLVPLGSGPAPHNSVDGISVRTGVWNPVWTFEEHRRFAAPPAVKQDVAVEIRGLRAYVRVEGEQVEVALQRKPHSVVVGGFKWELDKEQMWPASGDHRIQQVSIRRP